MINLKRYKESLTVFLLGLGLLAGASSCTDELTSVDPGNNGQEVVEDPIYINVAISQSNGTRADGEEGEGGEGSESSGTTSGTQTDYEQDMKHEDGRDYENEIKSLIVVLVNPTTYKVVTSVQIDNPTPKDGSTTEYTGKAKIEKKVIESYLNGSDKDVLVFLICNPVNLAASSFIEGQDIQKTITTSDVDDMAKYGSKTKDRQGNEFADYHFMMTNADYRNEDEDTAKDKYKVTIYKDKVDKGEYSEESPLLLGNIPVQRSMVRYDLDDVGHVVFYFTRDGQPKGQTNSGGNDWVSMEYFGVVNVSKKFNLFKETGLPSNGGVKGRQDIDWGYFWSEMPATTDLARYVFDPDYSSKKSLLSGKIGYDSYFHNSIFDPDIFINYENYDHSSENGNLILGKVFTYYEISGAGDNANIVWDEKKEYKIRRYTTPNTIQEAAYQKNGISTGAAFIARLNFHSGLGEGTNEVYLDEDGNELNKNELEGKRISEILYEQPIYAWNDMFYGINKELVWKSKHPDTDADGMMAAAFSEATGSRWAEMSPYLQENGNPGNPDDYDSERMEQVDETLYNDFLWLTSDGIGGGHIRDRFKRYGVLPSKVLAEKLTQNGFGIYIPRNLQGHSQELKNKYDGDYMPLEYMCYYIAWIRHNDNGNSTMGPMEFGVVRNNIYKLRISSVKRRGHPLPDPNIPTDPDPFEPGTDDEIATIYMTLDCQVVDWQRRQHGIHF